MFFCEECPIKKKRKKEVDQFRVGEVKDVVSEEDVLFKKKRKVQQYRSCLNLDANFYCDFPLFIYINAGHILEFICTCMLSLSFLLVESVRMVIVCAFSF